MFYEVFFISFPFISSYSLAHTPLKKKKRKEKHEINVIGALFECVKSCLTLSVCLCLYECCVCVYVCVCWFVSICVNNVQHIKSYNSVYKSHTILPLEQYQQYAANVQQQ